MNLLAAGAYLLFLIVIGVWSVRRNKDARDYFLAGGRLGLFPAVLATMASIMSGFVFVGGPGLFYDIGLVSFWITISSSFTGAMMCWVLAKPLFAAVREGDCISIPDVILYRYECRFCSGISAAGILIGVLGYLATQLAALGVILSTMLPVSVQTAAIAGTLVLTVYAVAGGMVASVYTDVVQGALMVWAATCIFYFALDSAGGMEQISMSFLENEADLLGPWGRAGIFTALGWFLVFSLGSLGQPHVVNKFMMIRSLRVLKIFPLVLAASMILCGLIWLGGGLAMRSLVFQGRTPPLENPDMAIPVFLAEFAPAWLAALALVGITSAIMSTADSFANVGAAAITRDIPRALGRVVSREVFWGRLSTLLLFIAAFLFASLMGENVALLGVFGFGSFAAALTPSLAVGLNWKRAQFWAARVSITLGIVLNLALELLQRFEQYPFQLPPSAVSLSISTLLFIIVASLVSKGINQGVKP